MGAEKRLTRRQTTICGIHSHSICPSLSQEHQGTAVSCAMTWLCNLIVALSHCRETPEGAGFGGWRSHTLLPLMVTNATGVKQCVGILWGVQIAGPGRILQRGRRFKWPPFSRSGWGTGMFAELPDGTWRSCRSVERAKDGTGWRFMQPCT